MTFSSPPPGGATWISRSTPAGGQITPLDCASLSLSGASLLLPTVGPLPLTSGGHTAPCCSGTRSVPTGCASAVPAGAKPTEIAKIKPMVRTGYSSTTCAGQRVGGQKRSRCGTAAGRTCLGSDTAEPVLLRLV